MPTEPEGSTHLPMTFSFDNRSLSNIAILNIHQEHE